MFYASEPDHHLLIKGNGNQVYHIYRTRGILLRPKSKMLQVASGSEIRGDPGPQPSGSNIRELVWNDELARVAQV